MKTFKEYLAEISIEVAGRSRAARFREVDDAHNELRSWKRLIPGRKKQIKDKISKAYRGIRRADDTEYRRTMGN